ncbi:MAG: hypothetical protein R3325_14515 [Thermoanaerobaculia bacterium]|nr:hypothetical protein [Thermoanaerobaculia bacterium]
MKALGYLLVTAGFLFGSYQAVLQPSGVPVPPYLAGVIAGAIGVAMVRLAIRRETRQEDVVAANLEAIDGALARVVEKVKKLDAEKETVDVYELRHLIDDRFPEDLDTFVQARQSIAHSHGLQAYADVMNPFAAGERYLNRVWSTSTDGYIDEAHEYLGKAREQFEEALGIFRELRVPRSTPS